ncbi:hypothetical protein QVD17_36786 [Tagetes erecta]|uniref:Uncharacterized protein n=1 Tax=Tagetes erecta TaxID=13708 RepID=A0AAD8NJA0_TARER|nr:hypothetical protein QVD17_36786 [Tagetes erecta]
MDVRPSMTKRCGRFGLITMYDTIVRTMNPKKASLGFSLWWIYQQSYIYRTSKQVQCVRGCARTVGKL